MEISNNIQIFVPNNMGRKIKHNYLVIQEEHKKGFSLKFLSKKYNIPLQSIYSHFQNKKISYNKDIVPRRKGYTVNDNYFDIIDTEEKLSDFSVKTLVKIAKFFKNLNGISLILS